MHQLNNIPISLDENNMMVKGAQGTFNPHDIADIFNLEQFD